MRPRANRLRSTAVVNSTAPSLMTVTRWLHLTPLFIQKEVIQPRGTRTNLLAYVSVQAAPTIGQRGAASGNVDLSAVTPGWHAVFEPGRVDTHHRHLSGFLGLFGMAERGQSRNLLLYPNIERFARGAYSVLGPTGRNAVLHWQDFLTNQSVV
jgi:hypothetical protein